MTLGISLHTHAKVAGVQRVVFLKVLGPADPVPPGLQPGQCARMTADGAIVQIEPLPATPAIEVRSVRDGDTVAPGDVIRLRPGSDAVSVVWRRAARSNALFATERCTSACLMCSQPPREIDDGWRVAELIQIAELIDHDANLLTITGGEPTLLGGGLSKVIRAVHARAPSAEIQVLTNGRALQDVDASREWLGAGGRSVRWAIPLYAPTADVHDHVVQSLGAYEETVQGLYVCAAANARVELRVVVHKITAPHLRTLATFIYRRLPFVEHVALMGIEPMGFAKRARDQLWIDPVDYVEDLAAATYYLANRGMPVSIYNLPLCILPEPLRPFARQSISEWKTAFAPECSGCEARSGCAGFFSSAGPEWRSRRVAPIRSGEVANAVA